MNNNHIPVDDVSIPDRHVDIVYLTRTYNLAIVYLYPLRSSVRSLILLRSWKYPLLSSLAFISLFALLLHPTFIPGSLIILTSSALLLMLASFITQYSTENRELSRPKYQIYLNNSYQNDLTQELEQGEGIQQDIRDFRSMLLLAQDNLNSLIKIFDSIYCLISWANHFNSTVFVGILFLIAVLLLILPSVTISLLLSTLLCCNVNIISLIISFITPSNKCKEKKFLNRPEEKIRSQSDVSLSPNMTDANEIVPPDVPQTGVATPRRRMTRDRHDLCHKCETILRIYRKKRMCQKCGNTFCGNCSMKIKKSYLGVTAPNASKETVDVCIPCNQRLTGSPSLRPNRMVLQDSILPSSIFAATNLNELYLRNNPLLLISEEISNFTYLRTLSASFCLLEDLPNSIYSLCNLRELDISYNRLKRISYKFCNLRELMFLNLEGNELPGLPIELTFLQKLKFLKATSNFMHPLIWNDSLNKQPDHLQDICMRNILYELYDDDMERVPTNLSTLFTQRHNHCANCELTFFGFGREIIFPSNTPDHSVHSFPVLFNVCAERCIPFLKERLKQN
ncbi:Leucine-rich repeat-containing protein 63-like [Oopsacas minuta]|uniref:Protrudin n=1 Tax=Oopsacas minuta TaxID=111878 RepID=A0AAV7K2B0_9METZ|nr:Leucine-rich repeat-containing protein 63-like [Oopsacas minuta]